MQTLGEGETWSSQSLEVALSARDLNVDSETVVGGRSAADSNGLEIAFQTRKLSGDTEEKEDMRPLLGLP